MLRTPKQRAHSEDEDDGEEAQVRAEAHGAQVHPRHSKPQETKEDGRTDDEWACAQELV
jgi:hypothetical protein